MILPIAFAKNKSTHFFFGGGLCTWQIMANQFLVTMLATGRGHNYQLIDFTQRRISNFEVAHDQVQWGSKTYVNDWRSRDSM